MVRVDSFIIDSDFPMPAQSSVVQRSLSIPSGASGEYRVTIPIGNASIFRASFNSSRTGKTFVGGTSAIYTAGSDTYVCALGISSAGSATVRVMILGTTSSSETVTVSLSCFIMP